LAAGVEEIPHAPERIYVSRFDTRHRVIANEGEVRRVLETFGFIPLAQAFLPLRTQIGLFRGARFVVGAHGAGLTNLAFCQPGTTVLELIQSNYPMLLMNRIARQKGLRYHAEYFECEGADDPHGQEWTVDTSLLETRVSSLLRSSVPSS
jgi:capsular polysaccharide biosynthesis protein